MTVKLRDTKPGMTLLDKQRRQECVVVGVNHDAGLIWLSTERTGLSRSEFDERGYETRDPSAAFAVTGVAD